MMLAGHAFIDQQEPAASLSCGMSHATFLWIRNTGKRIKRELDYCRDLPHDWKQSKRKCNIGEGML